MNSKENHPERQYLDTWAHASYCSLPYSPLPSDTLWGPERYTKQWHHVHIFHVHCCWKLIPQEEFCEWCIQCVFQGYDNLSSKWEGSDFHVVPHGDCRDTKSFHHAAVKHVFWPMSKCCTSLLQAKIKPSLWFKLFSVSPPFWSTLSPLAVTDIFLCW